MKFPPPDDLNKLSAPDPKWLERQLTWIADELVKNAYNIQAGESVVLYADTKEYDNYLKYKNFIVNQISAAGWGCTIKVYHEQREGDVVSISIFRKVILEYTRRSAYDE